MELYLASFHFLMIFATFAFLAGEFVLLRVESSESSLRLLSRIDLLYGLFAGLVILSGVLRVFLGTLPAEIWAVNVAFWAKMGVFAAIGGLSIIPTLQIMKWKKAWTTEKSLPDGSARKKVAFWVHLELALFALLPILAVLMGKTAG